MTIDLDKVFKDKGSMKWNLISTNNTLKYFDKSELLDKYHIEFDPEKELGLVLYVCTDGLLHSWPMVYNVETDKLRFCGWYTGDKCEAEPGEVEAIIGGGRDLIEFVKHDARVDFIYHERYKGEADVEEYDTSEQWFDI